MHLLLLVLSRKEVGLIIRAVFILGQVRLPSALLLGPAICCNSLKKGCITYLALEYSLTMMVAAFFPPSRLNFVFKAMLCASVAHHTYRHGCASNLFPPPFWYDVNLWAVQQRPWKYKCLMFLDKKNQQRYHYIYVTFAYKCSATAAGFLVHMLPWARQESQPLANSDTINQLCFLTISDLFI